MLKLIIKGFARSIAALPLTLAMGLGRGAGWFYGSVIRYHRQDAIDALKISLPDKSEKERRAIVRRMYRNLGYGLVEYIRSVGGKTEEQFKRIEGLDEIKRVVDEQADLGKGILFMSGHIGNWEFLGTVPYNLGRPGTIVGKPIKLQALNEVVIAHRERFGLKVLRPRGSYRPCLSALRRNQMLGVIVDQNMTRSEGLFVNFFGRLASTTPALAYLSAQSGAAVVPLFMIRTSPTQHRIVAGTPIPPPPDREPETIREATQAYTRVIEDVIREHPEQWIWIHRRWRTRPLSEKKMIQREAMKAV